MSQALARQLDKFPWHTLPLLLVESRPINHARWGHLSGDSLSARRSKKMDKLVERTRHNPDSLLEMLNRQVAVTKRAFGRSFSRWGRILNWMSGDNSRYIRCSGLPFVQLLEVQYELPNDLNVPFSANCKIRLDEAMRIFEALLCDVKKSLKEKHADAKTP